MRTSPSSFPRPIVPALLIFASVLILGATVAMAQTFAPPATPGGGAATPQATPRQQGQPPTPTAGVGRTLSGGSGMSDEKVYTGERISLDFQNADIHNILRLIGEVSGKNVVVSDAVSGKVTLKLRNVPWDQALDIVLASKNLDVEENGNVLRVDTRENMRRAAGPDTTDPNVRVALEKWTYTPVYASITSLAAELEKAKSIRGTVKVIGNDIYVEDDVETVKALRDLARRNDKVTKQILIEARIVEANAKFTQDLGVRWGGAYDRYRGNMVNHTDAMDLVGTQMTEGDYAPGEAFGAMSVSNEGIALGMGFLNRAGTLLLNAQLTASEVVSQTKVISAPRIMAANDQQVYIKQGTQVPYKSGGGLGTNTSTEFKDALMELRVTPHIEENGQIVTLEITLTKDSVGDMVGDEPAIDKKEAYTKLMVKNGETVVIGGIITDNQLASGTRVPGLHAIPLLGWLFENKHVDNDKKELIIFITASIIPINI
ncbi:MAG: type IV pilus secretin PilQ [Deltaproteobacteria bacterium]|jgi:type IV pilus assembly protein PilQ|nr:type IV pilus secretin PilQ [Deltaproteobacteria bacterium]